MAQPIPTNINAFYADLITAKQASAAAAQKVIELEDAIRAKGGVVPGEEVELEEVAPEPTASSNDVSASEAPATDTSKGSKK